MTTHKLLENQRFPLQESNGDLTPLQTPYEGGEMKYTRITVNPNQMNGVPCIRGLRIPVATVVGMIAEGMTEKQILSETVDNQNELRDKLEELVSPEVTQGSYVKMKNKVTDLEKKVEEMKNEKTETHNKKEEP